MNNFGTCNTSFGHKLMHKLSKLYLGTLAWLALYQLIFPLLLQWQFYLKQMQLCLLLKLLIKPITFFGIMQTETQATCTLLKSNAKVCLELLEVLLWVALGLDLLLQYCLCNKMSRKLYNKSVLSLEWHLLTLLTFTSQDWKTFRMESKYLTLKQKQNCLTTHWRLRILHFYKPY